LPLISSGFYAVTVIYAFEVGRSWLLSKPNNQHAVK
jgi:hypothetical protein